MAGKARRDLWSAGLTLETVPGLFGHVPNHSNSWTPTANYYSALSGNDLLSPKAAVFQLTPTAMLASGIQNDVICQSNSYAATKKALGIPELQEAILNRLPHRDLLMMQRVSKTWQALIQDSDTLQQKLFLQALPPTHIFLITRTEMQPAPFGGPRTLTTVVNRVPASSKLPKQYHAIQASINPFLGIQCPTTPQDQPSQHPIDARAKLGERILIHPPARAWSGSTRAPPSAFKMHLTQPPTTRVTVALTDNRGSGSGTILRKVVVKAGGVRFGDVMEAYGALLGACAYPDYEAVPCMRTAQEPSLEVLFEPAQRHTSNAVLFASFGEVEVVLGRAAVAADDGK
ncbi:putative F-box domain-containing protein [Septoria linicola]|nr:putative F-box domain-containing protein [Septoria linicola]